MQGEPRMSVFQGRERRALAMPSMRGSTTSMGFGVRKRLMGGNLAARHLRREIDRHDRGASPAAARRRGWKCGITAVAKFRERRIKLESRRKIRGSTRPRRGEWRTNFSRKPIVKRRNGELVRLQETLLRRRWKKINDVAQKKTVKEARLRLEKEMEMVLVVEKLQELRSLLVQKLKEQGHLFSEDDDAFTESVRAAVEAEERQAGGATAEAFPANAEEQTTRNPSTDDENTIKEATPQPSNTKRSEELDQRLPPDLYRYYYRSRIDMRTRGLSTPGISYL